MLKTGMLNPQLLSLLARVRHTNTLVIADKGFPSWPRIETVDLSLIAGIPRVLDVVAAILAEWQCGRIWMAQEFRDTNPAAALVDVNRRSGGLPIEWEPHNAFKLRVPGAVGIIRTGDDIPYANMILESA